MKVQRPNATEGRDSVVVAYAIAAMIWRVVVSVSLAVSAEVLLHGAGAALAVAAVGLWVGLPLYKSIRLIAENQTADRRRMMTLSVLAAASVWLCWSSIPWYSRSTVPLIVDYHPPQEIRVPVDGFLDEKLASTGDVVARGQILARLSNLELELEHENLRLEIKKSEARHRNYLTGGSIAAAKVEQKTQATLGSRLQQIEQQLSGLVVRAPVEGVIATSDLEFLEGSFIRRGDRLFVIGTPSGEKIVGLVDQADVDAFRQSEGQPLDIRLWGMGNERISGTIRRVLPRASRSLPFPALGAAAGGPLSLRRNPQAPQDEDSMQLVDPRFSVLIDVAGYRSENVMPGQTGYARLNYRNGTLGRAVWNSLGRWIEDKRAMLKAQG